MSQQPSIRGRGAASNPPNRFEEIAYLPDPAARDPEDPAPQTTIMRDATRTIIAHNDSPDVGFDSSVNPYRGCEHGWNFCFPPPLEISLFARAATTLVASRYGMGSL